MLTLKQINEVSFRKSSFSGYKPEDVDEFIDEVCETYKVLVRENQAYKAKLNELSEKANELQSKNAQYEEKMKSFANKISTYRDDEESIKDLLVNAQKLSSSTLKEAREKSEAMIADAKIKAEEILSEAQIKTDKLNEEYDSKVEAKEKEFNAIKEKVTEFRSSLYEMYRNHITSVEAIPDFTDEIAARKQEEAKKAVQEEIKIEVKEPVVEEIDYEDVKDVKSTSDEMYVKFTENDDDKNSKDSFETSFDTIDFDAYKDIPKALKDKEATFNTLEFGDDIEVSRKRKNK